MTRAAALALILAALAPPAGECSEAERVLAEAKRYFDKGYLDLAAARYREAYALDPENPDAMIGVADAYAEEGKEEEAIPLYEAALAKKPEAAIPTSRLGRLYQNRGVKELGRFWPRPDREKAGRDVDRGLAMQELAASLTKDPDELGYIYYEWAVALALRRDYRQAWEKLHLSHKHGEGRFIQPDFVEQLSHDMVDPYAGNL